MSDIAAWVALTATCAAALLTAANLGTRATGWGFAVFTIGAVAWVTVGVSTGQKQLLFSNIFLGLVDVFGVWRWLGHRAKIDDATCAEEDQSEHGDGAARLSVAKLIGMPVKSPDGTTAAEVVDALADRSGGGIRDLVVCHGGVAGVGATLHRLPWRSVRVERDHVWSTLSVDEIASLPIAGAG